MQKAIQSPTRGGDQPKPKSQFVLSNHTPACYATGRNTTHRTSALFFVGLRPCPSRPNLERPTSLGPLAPSPSLLRPPSLPPGPPPPVEDRVPYSVHSTAYGVPRTEYRDKAWDCSTGRVFILVPS